MLNKPITHDLFARAVCLDFQFPDPVEANAQSNSAVVSARIINVTDRYPPALPL
jgi:hypothetical protein